MRAVLAGILVAAMLAGVAGPAAAGRIAIYAAKSFGSGADRGEIVILDQSDAGNSSSVGNPGLGLGITGIDFDNDGNLWGTTLGGLGSTSALIRLDAGTGAVSAHIGPIHTDPSDAAGSAISIGDLAFDPVSHRLYGIQSLDHNPAEGGSIFTIDLGTGLASLVGPTIWGTTAGLAFDSAGTLYALGFDPDVGPFGTNMLFTLDASDAGELSRVTVSRNEFVFSGLGINPETDEIYAIEDDYFATGTGTGNVFLVDLDTGDMTFLGKPDGVVSDIAFRVAEPGTLAAMAIGLLGLGVARRRRVG